MEGGATLPLLARSRGGRSRVDINYLLHRQQVERTRAEAAESDEARTAHEQLARCYEAIILDATNGKLNFSEDAASSSSA